MRKVEYHGAQDFYRLLACYMVSILGFRKIFDNVNRKIYSANINNITYRFYYYYTNRDIMLKRGDIVVSDTLAIRELAKLLGYEC
jgi:hypothetical protein